MTFRNPTAIEPNTFESTGKGYWAIIDGNGDAIGVMHGRITASFAKGITYKAKTGCFVITTAETLDIARACMRTARHTFKPIPEVDVGTAIAFGFGTMYDPEKLPNLVKLPDEIPLDTTDTT